MSVADYRFLNNFISSILECKIFWFAILIFFNSRLVGQKGLLEPYTETELTITTKRINELMSKGEWTDCEDLLVNMTDHYKIKGIWDSVYHYNYLLSEVANNSGNLNLEMRGYLERVSQDGIFKRDTTENYINGVNFIKNNLDTNRLSPEVLTQAYSSHASHLFDNSYVDSSAMFRRLSLEMADKSGKPILKITSRLEYGLTLQYLKMYEEKLSILLEAEELAVEYMDDPVFKFRIYKDIGNLLINIDDLEKADYYVDKAIATADEAGYSLFRADTEILKGKILSKCGEYDKALAYYSKAIDKYKEVNYNSRLSKVYIGMANIQIKAKDYKAAKQSLDFVVKYGADSSISYKCALANYNLAIGNYEDVKSFLDSKDNQKALLDDNYADLYYLIKYKYYKSINAYDQSLSNYERHIALRDSINTSAKELRVHRIESEYNRNKQSLEIDNLNKLTTAQDKALAVRNTALWMGGGMLLILGGLLFGLYRLYNRDKENQKELAIQNKKVTETLAQNQVLMKEIHHRVKNNLQVVSSLLSMQARKVKDGDTKDALNSSKTRVQSMSILHQNLYQGNDITGVNIDEYLQKLVENIVDTYQVNDNIKIDIDIDPITLDVDTLVPLGLIANELICNALKYAFVGKEHGTLNVSVKKNGEKLVLRVADDGIGFDGEELPIKKGSLGARLIKSFSERLGGVVKIDKSNGTDVSIEFDKENF